MDQELQNKLFDKYPNLYVNKDKGIQASCMAFGCEVGNGWYELLSSLCHRIKNHEENIASRLKYHEKNNTNPSASDSCYIPVTFDQVKEKYGGLRVYFSGGDDYVFGAVSMAEEYSYKICEICGNAGKPNKGGWISTLCDNCRNKT